MDFIPNMNEVQFKNKFSKTAYKVKYVESDGTSVEFPLGYLLFSGMTTKCAIFSTTTDGPGTVYNVCIRPPLDDSSDENVLTVKNYATKEIILNEKGNPVIIEDISGGKRKTKKTKKSKKSKKSTKRKGRKMTRRHKRR
jgi:hypothetical protein